MSVKCNEKHFSTFTENSKGEFSCSVNLCMNILRTFLNVWINANIDHFPCESVYFPLLCNDG